MTSQDLDPLVHKEPPSFDTSPTALKAEAEALIKTTTALCDEIVSYVNEDKATFDNTIRPIAENENYRSGRENHLRFYASTHPAKEIREASYAVQSLFNNAEADFFSNANLFTLVDFVFRRVRAATETVLDNESMHYLVKLHQRFLVNGCGIADGEQRADFVSKKKRIDELARECRKNMANEQTGVWLTRDELKGLTESFVSRLIQGESNGKQERHLWVSTKTPFSVPVLKHAKNEATRKKMYYAVMNRMPQNIPLHRELVLLRAETSRLLGWPNHFAFKTSQKMTKTPTAVHKLLSEVRAALRPVAEQHANSMRDLKVQEAVASGESSTKAVKLFHWDRAYFEARADENMGNAESLVSEYFELDTTLQRLLDIYEHIFGVKFVPMGLNNATLLERKMIWYEDVQMLSAWNVDETEPSFLGYAYLDLFPRDGKYTHAGQYALQRVGIRTWMSSSLANQSTEIPEPGRQLVSSLLMSSDELHETVIRKAHSA